MRHLTNGTRQQIRRHRRGASRALALFLALAMVVSLGVDLGAASSVYASESDSYTCGKTAHTHDESCYETKEVEVLDCDQKEHEHSDNCYEETRTLICEETEHTHEENCYDEDGNLICDLEEHTHTDDCYEIDRERTCGFDEHTHNEDCYTTETQEVLNCDRKEHEHTDACKDDDTIESTHVANADYDKEWTEAADEQLATDKDNDETKAQTLADLASSQAGYTAQILDDNADDEDVEALYSLYSNWYTNGDNSTKDWNTTFVFWALNKAGFDTEKELDATSTALPIRSDLSAWIKALQAKEEATLEAEDTYAEAQENGDEDATPAYSLSLYIDTEENGLSLTAGDILFLDLDQNGSVDHVGVAASVDTDEDTDTTNSVAIIIGDLDQKTLEDLDDTNDALDSDNSDANVAAGIALPADDYDGEWDDADAVESYLESYIIGTIPMSLYEQQLEEIHGDGGKTDGQTDSEPDLAPGTVYGKTHTPKKSKTSDTVMMTASNDGGISPADGDTLTGIDLNGKLGSVVFKKRVGSVWVESSEFTTDDTIQAEIKFDNIQTSLIKANGNTLYVQLPDIIDCSGFTDTYDTYDGSKHSGKYRYQKVGDSWYVVLTLDTDYVDEAGDYIGGELDFQFSWDKEQVPDEGKTTEVIIGDQGATIKIEKGDDKGESKGHKYNLYKQAGSLEWSEDGKTAYITYTVNLTVNNSASSPITLHDVLYGTGFEYDSTVPTITGGDNVKVNYAFKEQTSTDIQIWAISGNEVPAGNYTITYKVKTSVADASDWSIDDQTLSNEIKVPDDDDSNISSKTWSTVTTGTVDKKGNLVSGTDGIYIDYTVYLNSGTIVKNIKTPAQFSDTLPDSVQLQGDVTVKQYKPDGTLVSTTKATVNGQDISYTTPTGQYYYIITYRTKLKDTITIPAAGLEVKNTGTSTGGIEGSKESTVVVPNQSLKKNFVSQNLAQINDRWTDTIKWSSTIDVEDFKDCVYEDWGDLKQKAADASGNQYWFSPLTMSESQRSTIKVTDKNGNTVDNSKYTITTSDHTGLTTQPADASGTLVNNGLFKITFHSDDIEGPVKLEYETSVDMSNFTIGSYLVFINHASLTKNGESVHAQAQTTTLEYAIDLKKVIHKYGAGWSTGSSESVTLDPGQDYISWTIGVNEGMAIFDEDLVVADTLQDGLTLDESSLKVMLGEVDLLHLLSNQQDMAGLVSYTYDKVTNKLVINIDKKAYSGTKDGQKYSQALKILFNTKLPENFISGGDAEKTFKNTATVTRDGGEETPSTYEETVKRQVVGKSGSYDPETQMLTYQIVLNPDAATLSNGTKNLKVTDTLDAGDLKDYIQLESIELFTAVKTINSKNKVEVKPGKFVRTLTDIKTTGSSSLLESDLNHYRWVPSKDADESIAANTFMTYIEDSTAYVAVVKYSITEKIAADTQMNNHVEIEGDSKWSKTDSTVKATQKTSGETYTGHRLKIIKHDTADYNTLLGGATFRVDKYVDGTWTQGVITLTTAADTGSASSESSKIEGGYLYRIVETEAPSGYVEDNTPSYFVILVGEATMPTLPSDVAEDKVLKVHVDDGKAANVVIDRYNSQDTSKVEPGQIRVTKEWLGYSGEALSETAVDGKSATVTLKKYAMPKKLSIKIAQSGNEDSNYEYSVANGGYLVAELGASGNDIGTTWAAFKTVDEFKESILFDGTADTSKVNVQTITEGYSYKVKIGPFTSDCVITDKKADSSAQGYYLYYKRYNNANFFTVEGGEESTTPVETTIGSVTLNKDNDWTYVWSDLDRDNGEKYTLVEQTVDGFKTSYTINGEDLEPGAQFTPSTSGDKIVVKNQKEPTELIVHKVWNDANADHSTGSVTIHLFKDGKDTGQFITLDASKDWTGKFSNLEIDDGNGHTYEYTVTEDAVTDYTTEIVYTTVKPDWYTADETAGSSVKYATVTNTKQYTMPSTGGAGTLPYMLGGSAALISSMFAGCSMRRRRRDERRCN